MQAKLPYHRPTLESLGSMTELTQGPTFPGAGGDSTAYGPATPPPGS